jgi:trimethylamine-N-oxide reductase (cytochrome c)
MTFVNMNRRNFLQGGTAVLGAKWLLGSTAIASPLDPNSFSLNRVFHASHYGPFEAIVREGRIVGINAIPELDQRPTEMLLYGVLDRTYDKTRIEYPMIRKSYLEGWRTGDTKPELRGKEEFVRVDWDTALKIAAKAIVDTIETHGNQAIMSTSYGGWSHPGMMKPNVVQGKFFNQIGGCTNTVGDYSAGASQISLPHIIGDMEVYSAQTAWEVIRDNTEVFVLVGCDPIKNNRIEYSIADHGMYAPWEQIRDNGCKFISINPQKTASDNYLDAEWVRIVPNTDVALFLAMSYHVVEQGLDDKEYMARYTVGADKWLAYVKGETDGTPKTPEWAAAITGIDAAKIRELAELLAKSKTEIAGAWSLQRAHHGELTHWAIINFASLTGKIGKPGQGVGFSWHYGNGGMPQSGGGTPNAISQGRNLVTDYIVPAGRIIDALENPEQDVVYNGVARKYPDVKLIYNSGNNFMSHQQNTNRLIKALGKVETIICQDVWWTAATRWSDIVFAAASTLERDDISAGGTYSNDRIYAMKKVIEPLGESRNDWDIFAGLADLLGMWAPYVEQEQFPEYMDIIKLAYSRTTAAQTTSFEDFWEKGYALQPAPQKARQWVRHGAFYEDPEANPLHTKSGKIEMFCETIDALRLEDCPGMPMWLEPAEYLGNAKEGQLHLVSPHPWYRLHSQMANSQKLRDLYMIQGREPVRINRQDAEARGIAEGDLVEVYNDRGTVIAGAVVSDEIMPGVVSIYEGGWPSLDSKGRCNSGLVNFLTSTTRSSGLSHANTANTALVSIRKCEDPEGPNQAYDKPAIIEDFEIAAIDDDELQLDRIYDIVAALYADMSPGERTFYERCTVCHGPRDPAGHTQLQWKAITESMFPRAGLEGEEAQAVMDFLMQNAADAAN